METFLVRTEGGPHPGTRMADEAEWPWPLPDQLNDEGGRYVKISESDLPPQPEESRVLRGARYRWEPAG
jgi:hypothetical protein